MNINNLSLKQTLFITFLSAGLLPIMVAGYIFSKQAVDALESAAFSQLESVRDLKRIGVEDYFHLIHDQIDTFSESKMVTAAMVGFNQSFHERDLLESLGKSAQQKHLNKLKAYYTGPFDQQYQKYNGGPADTGHLIPSDPLIQLRQYQYIANNPYPLGEKDSLNIAEGRIDNYDKFHKEYHPLFRNYLDKFGYYDIFLVDADTGDIVYSVFKQIDFGTSLTSGPYSNTNVARAFRRAIESHDSHSVFLEDFEHYLPSYEAASSFISSPIYNGDKLEGVLIFKMPIGRINHIMENVTGLGDSAETYLVGGDGLMRSQSRFIEENTIAKQKAASTTVAKALKGEQGGDIIVNYRDVNVLSSYGPVNVEGLSWAVIAEVNEDEAFAVEYRLLFTLLTTIVISSIAVIIMTIMVVKRIQTQLGDDPREIKAVAEAIANNDLSMTLRSPEESSGVYASMSTMRDNLRDSIERDRAIAAESTRIKQALDNVNSSVMVTDNDNKVIYLNKAISTMFQQMEADIRTDLPSFSADSLLGSNISVLSIPPGTTTQETEVILGDRTLVYNSARVTNEENEQLGNVIEWSDRTKEVNIQKDIEALVSSAQQGDLSKRMTLTDKDGFFLDLSTGMNELVETLSGVFEEVAQIIVGLSKGDLQEQMAGSYSGTFATVQNDINQTITKLNDIVGGISESASQIKTGSTEISSGNANLSSRTEQQASSLEETSATVEQLTEAVRHNANNAQQAHQLSSTAQEIAHSGGKTVEKAIVAMSEISDSSNKISDIIGVIDEIAFQTNLLALNASVEAARAGEQGRGFAVVATEVRNLAQRSATSAKEIKELIQDSVNKVDAGSALVNESGETLDNIVTSVLKVSDIIAEISASSQEQAESIDQVNIAIADLDNLTQQNAALAEETSAASESVSEQVNDMARLIQFFKTNS